MVTSIDGDGDTTYIHTNKRTWLEMNEVKPIIITDEWLLNLGFKKETNGSSLIGFFDVHTLGYMVYNTSHKAFWYDGKQLKKQPIYIHELQNLFFALSGEELVLEKHFEINTKQR